MLNTKQKLLILDYAETDGNVTMTLDEVTQLFEEIEQLKDENAKLLASEAVTYNKNKKLKAIIGHYRESDLEKSVKLNELENMIEELKNELNKAKFEEEYYAEFTKPSTNDQGR